MLVKILPNCFEIKTKTDEKSSVIFTPPGALFWDVSQIQSNSTIFSLLNPSLVQFNPENLILSLSKSAHSLLCFSLPHSEKKKGRFFCTNYVREQGGKVNKQNF